MNATRYFTIATSPSKSMSEHTTVINESPTADHVGIFASLFAFEIGVVIRMAELARLLAIQSNQNTAVVEQDVFGTHVHVTWREVTS